MVLHYLIIPYFNMHPAQDLICYFMHNKDCGYKDYINIFEIALLQTAAEEYSHL